jgi:23S rRNA pseudouridine2605 synthase
LPKGKGSVEINLREGKKKEIRRMFKAMGYKDLSLQRIGLNGLKLGSLKEGKWKWLNPGEIRRLKREVSLREEMFDSRH